MNEKRIERRDRLIGWLKSLAFGLWAGVVLSFAVTCVHAWLPAVPRIGNLPALGLGLVIRVLWIQVVDKFSPYE